MLILIVAGGPDKGRIYELHEDQPVILGREGDQIRLNDRKCSRKHAKVWAEGGKWYVRDLHSRHGTHVNATQVENKHELADGDHIQIGSTLFVLARMTHDHAERMALLGDAGQASPDTAPIARLVRPRLVLGGAAAAAALLIGTNAFFYFVSQQQTDRLAQQIQQAQARAVAPEETQQTLREILAGVQAQREQERLLTQIVETLKGQPEQATMLREVLAKLDGAAAPNAQTREMLQTLLARVEAQPQAEAKTQELLAAVLERVESQPVPDVQPLVEEVRALAEASRQLQQQPAPDVEPLVSEVKALAEAARQQQQTLLARVSEQDEFLRESLAQLGQPQAPDAAVVESLEQAVASGADNAALLRQILASLDQQKTIAAEVGALRALVERQPQATQAVLREIVKSMPADDDAAVLAAIGELKRSAPPEVNAKLDAVLTRLDSPAASPDDVATALRAALDQRQAATDEAFGRLASRLDDLAKSQPSTQELLAAIDAAQREPDPQLLARLDAIAKQLEVAAADAAADDDSAAIVDATRETRQMLADVLAEVRNREPFEGLRAQVARLAEAQAQTPPATAEATAATEAQLAEMRELIRAWPQQTESMLKEMVTAIADANDPEAEAIQGVLSDIKQRAIARLDELDSAIRADIRAGLAQELEAGALAETSQRPARPTRPTRSAVLADNMADSAGGLTKTEEAYKTAFETGKAIRIGAGVVNAATGEVSEGRILDPAMARAAGIKSWRDWYNQDEFSEWMRLQKQALRYAGDRAGRNDVITLPSNSALVPAAVEQASPAAESAQNGG